MRITYTTATKAVFDLEIAAEEIGALLGTLPVASAVELLKMMATARAIGALTEDDDEGDGGDGESSPTGTTAAGESLPA